MEVASVTLDPIIMKAHFKQKPARMGRMMAWLRALDPRPRPAKAARKSRGRARDSGGAMTSIILAASPLCKRNAIAAGFREEKVLIRHEIGCSTKANKERIESELFRLRPYQFLVSDFWGMGAD